MGSGSEDDDEKQPTGQYDDDDSEEEVVKRKPKKKSKSSKYIDDAAEESDGEGGNVEDEDEDDEDDEDDDDLKAKGQKRGRGFIVDDDDEDGGGATKKERVRISREERKLDDDDYSLIQENLGLQVAREESSDDEEDGGQPQRKRLRQGGRADSDDEDGAKKVSRKKGLAGALFDDDDDGAEGAAAAAEAPAGRRSFADVDSDDSMADFIEDDDDAPAGEGAEGGGPRARRPRQRARRSERSADEENRVSRADDMFGEDEYDDEYPEEEEEMQQVSTKIDDLYEPTVIQEFYLAEKDVAVRKEDIPERLQIDFEGRDVVSTLDDVRAEAKWMVNKNKEIIWLNSKHIEDYGQDLVRMLNPNDGDEENHPEYIDVTRDERARAMKESLIEKVTNVLCFLRGIANDEIQHGGNFLVSKDDKRAGVPNWWQMDDDPEDDPKDATPCPIENIEDIKAVFDVPFIQHYRKEFYQPDLTPEDLWSIYDLDGKYCSVLTRQLSLSNVFRDKEDADGIKLCKIHDSEEGLADIKSLVDIKYPSTAGSAQDEAMKGRKMPVRASRHKVWNDAGLGKLVQQVCISPKKLCDNLLGMSKKHHPDDPNEEPAEYACDFVVDAEKYGFREAATVLEAARQMAAKELSVEPDFRRYVRDLFFCERNALLTSKITVKGENSSEEYHRQYKDNFATPLREIDEESFLWIMKAVKEGLLEVKVAISLERQNDLMREVMRYYQSDHNNPCASAWNKERETIMTIALETHIYKVLEQNIVDTRITKARLYIGRKVTKNLEALLRVPPYLGKQSDDSDSKRVKPERIMACCLAQPAEFVVIDKYGEVLAFKSMHIRVGSNHNNISAQFHDSELKQLRAFVDEQMPEVVVLGGDGLKCRTLNTQLTNAFDVFHTEGILKKRLDVILADQLMAYKYANSPRGLAEFPRYTPTRLIAVSLARRLQDPLREMSGLCAGLGEDVLSLQLHPLQDALHKAERLKFMHRAFINVVNEVGVDINLAADRPLQHGNTLQFVSGLGPRKARELLRIISKNLYLEHRAALLEDKEVRSVVREVTWYNCAAFLKITREARMWTKDYRIGQAYNDDEQAGEYVQYAGGPLEATRIHPESYKYARQMASDALDEEDDFNCLYRALHGPIDIRDKLRVQLDSQDLDLYGRLLRNTHDVRATETLKDIRSELLHPFEEARHLPSSGTLPWELNKLQEFNLLTGESMRRRGDEEARQGDEESTLVDQVVHVKVSRTIRAMPKEGQDYQVTTLPYKILCKLENGLTGVLMEKDFADTEEEKIRFQMAVREDMTISCVIMQVKFEEYAVELTHKTSRLKIREFGSGVSKKEQKRESKIKYVRRNIHHPYFKNVSRNGAMAYLKEEDVGEYVVRPSSQGMDLLTITRKVWPIPERFQETVIKMFDQPTKTGLGRSLQVEDKVFEDLDEMIIGYVEVMIKMDKKLTEHDKFYGGDAKEIRTRLVAQKQAAGGKGTPYCLGFNPAAHTSGYILFWLPGTKTVQEEKVKTSVSGYMFREQSFQSPSRLINWFKGHAMDLINRQQQQQRPMANPPAPSYIPPPPQGWEGSGMLRPNPGPPQHPPPPMQWGMGGSIPPPGAPPPGAPPAAAAGWPPGGDGRWDGGGPPGQGVAPPPHYQPPQYQLPAPGYVAPYGGMPGMGMPPPTGIPPPPGNAPGWPPPQ